MSRTKRALVLALAAAATAGPLASCYGPVGHPDPYVRQGRRTGAVVGGVTGAVIGNNVSGGNSWGGAAIGASVGALAGDRRGRVNSMYYRGRPFRYY
jgi:hypothetical protein